MLEITDGSIRHAIYSYFEKNPDVISAVHDAVGKSDNQDAIPEKFITEVREILANTVQTTDIEEVNGTEYQTCARAGLLSAWRRTAGDPDDQPELWLANGAPPAGIRMTPADRGISPVVQDEFDDPELLGTGEDHYVSSNVGPENIAEIKFQEFKQKGYVKEFDSYDELVMFLGNETPVFSEVHVITKVKNGRTKHRLILDCKKAGPTRSSRRAERSILPKVTDAVGDVMELSEADARDLVAMLILFGVLDFSDAFWVIPLQKSERRFFTTRIGSKSYMFLHTAQGSRGAPLTWSRFGAPLARLMQGILGRKRACLNLYVDDTLVAFLITLVGARRDFALIVLLWLALGLLLALKKAVLGRRVTWTSGIFDAVTTRFDEKFRLQLTVEVKSDTVKEVTELTTKNLRWNVMPIKELRSYTWTAFLRPLWAALTVPPGPLGNAPPGCVWAKLFQDSVLWIATFLKSEGDHIRRVYESEAYHGRGTRIEMDLDASSRGLGGIWRVNG